MQTNAQKVILTLVLSSLIGLPSLATADDQDRRQAKRIHDRLTGVPADNATSE